MSSFGVETYIALAALLLSAITLLDHFYGKAAAIQKNMAALENRITTLETKIAPFWRVMEEHLGDFLKQPIHLRMDALLDKFKLLKGEMSIEELIELKNELLSAKDEAKEKADPRLVGYVVMAAIVNSRIVEKAKNNLDLEG